MKRRCLMVLVAALACGGAEPAANGSGGGTLRIPLINDPILNPIIAPDIGSVMVNKVIFSGLVRPDEQLRPTPDLALSWTSSPDGKEWTFNLRPGVTWHDGVAFTAEDVKFTFDQVLDLSSGSRLRSDFAAVVGVDVVDSLTVRFRLKAPFAPLLTLLGYNAGILPKHALAGTKLTDAITFNRSTPVGTGPFKVERVTPGASVSLVRNEQYHGARPALDGIVFKVVPEVNAQVAQLRTGELDLVTIEPANLGSVEGVKGITVHQVPVVQHAYVGFNNRMPMFASALVRRALGYAVDRAAIVSGVLKGYADVPRGTIPTVLREFHDTALALVPHSVDSARALLAQAGWTPGPNGQLQDRAGKPFAFELLVGKGNPTHEQAALAVQQDLQKVGIVITIRAMEFAALVRDHVLPGTFQSVLIWWTTPGDPDQYAFYASGQDNNNVRWSNRGADSLLAAGRATLDSAHRREIYYAFQRIERDDPPVLVLYYPREIQAATSRLEGLPSLGIRDALRHSERLRFAK